MSHIFLEACPKAGFDTSFNIVLFVVHIAGSVINTMQAKEVEMLIERRREFEENFTRTIRDLRKELAAVIFLIKLEVLVKVFV